MLSCVGILHSLYASLSTSMNINMHLPPYACSDYVTCPLYLTGSFTIPQSVGLVSVHSTFS